MLKESLLACFICMLMVSCNDRDERSTEVNSVDGPEEKNITVFPVTDYLLGELATIEQLPVTPLETIEDGGRIDSVWIAREEVRNLAQPFLHYPIDSAVLYAYYEGQSFLDQTINMVTLTYTRSSDAPGDLPGEITVYVNPESDRVHRVYMVQEKAGETRQLTWKDGEWFSIRSLNGADVKERRVMWKFGE